MNYCKVDPVDVRVYTVHCLHVFTLFEVFTRIVFSYILGGIFQVDTPLLYARHALADR